MWAMVVLGGDQTGQVLLEEALRTMQLDVTGAPLVFDRLNVNGEDRRRSSNGVVRDAARAMRQADVGLEGATITPEVQGDIGSLNAIVRELIDRSVILRVGRCLPGVRTAGGAYAPAPNDRMATGDA